MLILIICLQLKWKTSVCVFDIFTSYRQRSQNFQQSTSGDIVTTYQVISRQSFFSKSLIILMSYLLTLHILHRQHI